MNRIPGLFLCMILLSACGREDLEYFPLEEGIYWRYRMHYEIMNGPMDTFFAIENKPEIRDDTGVLYEQVSMDGKSYFYRIDDQGLILTQRSRHGDFEDEYRDINRYLLRFPLQAGNEWQSDTWSRVLIKVGPPQKTEFRIVARVPVTVNIESMTDTIRVPAGVFRNCMRIRSTGSQFHDAGNYVGNTVVGIDETNWYAPGVGLVKSVRKETTTAKALDYGEIILELETYRD